MKFDSETDSVTFSHGDTIGDTVWYDSRDSLTKLKSTKNLAEWKLTVNFTSLYKNTTCKSTGFSPSFCLKKQIIFFLQNINSNETIYMKLIEKIIEIEMVIKFLGQLLPLHKSALTYHGTEQLSEHTGLISLYQLFISSHYTNTGGSMEGSHLPVAPCNQLALTTCGHRSLNYTSGGLISLRMV